MIILSGVLVVVAIALLVVGIVAGNSESAQIGGLDALTLIYISIAVSIVSLLCLIIGVFLRRKELFGAAAGASRPKSPKKREHKGKKSPAPAEPFGLGDTTDDLPAISSVPADVPPDVVVHVVRGRKRYHLDSCRQLAGRVKEELTYAEALEEGFSPCTACMPDTALAARAVAASGRSEDMTGARSQDEAETVTSPTGYAGTSETTALPERSGGVPSAWPVPKSTGSEAGRGGEPRIPSAWKPPTPSPARPESYVDSSSSDYFDYPDTDESYADAFAEPADDEATRAGVPRPAEPLSEPADHRSEDRTAETDEDIELAETDWTMPESWTRSAAAAEVAEDEDEPRTSDSFGGDSFTAESFTSDSFRSEPSWREPEIPEYERDDELEPAEPDAAADAAEADDEPETARSRWSDAADEDDDEGRTETASGISDEAAAAPAPVPHEDEDDAEPSGDGPTVRILSGTKRYHRADCALIEDIGDDADDLETLSREDAQARGCTPCLVCQPDREHLDD